MRSPLTGGFPTFLSALPVLTSLGVGNNNLTGSIPADIADFPELRILNISDNAFSGSIPEELGQVGLGYLDAARNDFSGAIPSSLADTDLDWLHLEGNALEGIVSESFAVAAEAMEVCVATPGNEDLIGPDLRAYRDADMDGDGMICEIPIWSAEDIGEDAMNDLDELVPDPLGEGSAGALKTRIENAVAKAANGQYGAAINQMEAFLNQLAQMVADGTLSEEQAAPFIEQANLLIQIWTESL
jgi:hypothetical protein